MKKIILTILLFLTLVLCNGCGKKNIRIIHGYFVSSDKSSITVDIYESEYISGRKITNAMSTCKDYAKLHYWDDKHCYMTGMIGTGKLEDTLCYWFLLDKNYNILKDMDSIKEIAYSLYIPQISYNSNGKDNNYAKEYVEKLDGEETKMKHIGIKKLNYR